MKRRNPFERWNDFDDINPYVYRLLLRWHPYYSFLWVGSAQVRDCESQRNEKNIDLVTMTTMAGFAVIKPA